MVLCTDQEVIPAKSAVCAHAQDFLGGGGANDGFLLSILQTLVHYTLLEILDVFRLCAVVEQSGAPTNSSLVVVPVVSSPAAPHQTRLPLPPTFPGGDHLMECGSVRPFPYPGNSSLYLTYFRILRESSQYMFLVEK